MRTKLSITAALALLMLGISCMDRQHAGRENVPGLDTIDISEVTTVLPDFAGREAVELSCVPCHSLRYIEMQPRMARKNWEKIVAKMITAYGAPVRDSATAAQIVDYLVHIKGA
jgi:hypothetical protein